MKTNYYSIPFKFRVISSVVYLLNLLLDGVILDTKSEASKYTLDRVIINDLQYYSTTGVITEALVDFILNAEIHVEQDTDVLSNFTPNEIRYLTSLYKQYKNKS